MKTLILKGGEVILDDEDYNQLCHLKWYIGTKGYALCTVKDSESRFMHHRILPAKAGLHVDHIDRNPLNNSRSNLRYATYSENAINSERSLQRTLPPRISRRGAGYRGRFRIKYRQYCTRVMPSVEEAQAALFALIAKMTECEHATNSEP